MNFSIFSVDVFRHFPPIVSHTFVFRGKWGRRQSERYSVRCSKQLRWIGNSVIFVVVKYGQYWIDCIRNSIHNKLNQGNKI